jgi:cyclophilin family peptidyl-prolyl cis-trans isomerase/HEAT repeat protein
MHRILIFASVGLLLSCGAIRKPVNKFSDSGIKAIADLQDKRSADSLITYLSHADPAYRLAAARAFISIQDSAAIPALSRLLLTDTGLQIKRASAIALGQIPSRFSAVPLRQSIDRDRLPESYEALGKVARSFSDLSALMTDGAENAPSEKAWMIYRYGLRSPQDSIPDVMIESILSKADSLSRIAFSQFLSRGVKKPHNLQEWLTERVLNDSNADVRMNAAFALRRIKHAEVHTLLTRVIRQDRDYRVRVNAIRSLQAFPLGDSWGLLDSLIQDKNTTVGLVASEVIFNLMTKKHVADIKGLILKSPNWRIRAHLYGAYMKAETSDSLVSAIKQVIAKSNSPYEKAALLLTLQFAEGETAFLFEKILTDSIPVVRSSAAAGLVQFLRQHGNDEVYRSILPKIISAFDAGDPAVVGTLAEAIADTTLSLHTFVQDNSFLIRAKSKLSLPRDIEALTPLENALARVEGRAPGPLTNPFDWSLVKRIPSDQRVLIETNKGKIVLQLFVDETPGTVANFVGLIERGYFNGKAFHRVVPNFVVQTGCNRGDGWGSEDYSIRSEFSERKFTMGSVGMASAGKDTEGTQWFITHSPTPHLDGRYTNFATVVSGMDVVHQLEVGDTILSMKLL